MKDFLTRRLAAVLAVLGIVIAALVVTDVILATRLGSIVRQEAEQDSQLERIELGAGLFASQVTALQSGLAELVPRVRAGLTEAMGGLDTFRASSISLSIPIDQDIPIDTEVVLDRTFLVPIETSVPIDETIHTTILVQGPFGTEIPVEVTVPVSLELPVDVEVPISLSEKIPISTLIPVRLTVPIEVSVAGTELDTLAASLHRALGAFADLLGGLE